MLLAEQQQHHHLHQPPPRRSPIWVTMGAYGSDRIPGVPYGRSSWDPAVEGGGGRVGLVDRFSRLGLGGGSSNNSIYQVMKAVEDAESTIKQQLEENDQLKNELTRKTEELEKYKSNAEKSLGLRTTGTRDEQILETHEAQLSSVVKGTDKIPSLKKSLLVDPSTAVIHQNGIPENEVTALQSSGVSQLYTGSNRGTVKVSQSAQTNPSNPGVSQYSLPSSRSVSPSRHQNDLNHDNRITSPTHGRMQAYELSGSSTPWKQDLVLKMREHEEEILQLKRHLADYSMKEAHICNEKYVLEKRIAHMRMAFDQQQQDLVDAASKALSYRQDIIEENIRLTHALQSAQEERSTYVSSLLPLLAEYGLQLSVPDALSIVSNLKVLFRHLHEKLIITEEKLKESQYQITPWHTEPPNASNFAPQSPSNSYGAAPSPSNKNGLEIVPQPPYSHALSPIASPSNNQTRAGWEALGHQNFQPSPGGFAPKSPNYHNMGNSSPPVDRTFVAEDIPSRVAISQDDSHVVHFSAESKEKSPLSKGFARGIDIDDSEATGSQHARESSMLWVPGSSPYMQPRLDDPHVSYPYLPPVIEEHSSFSEAADDDPLPAIEGLQISGEAYPGRELLACGYSTNGTTSCNFKWVRYLEDGSVNFIEFAMQPTYLVTADDVNCHLAIEVQPLDNRMRKGEPVRVFANEQRKITCDPEMQEEIEKILFIGHTSFGVSIPAGALDIWEPAVLAIKTEGYSIKCNGPRNVVVAEKFAQYTEITIPHGHPTEFSICGVGGVEHLLRTSSNSSLRDTIVLTLRLFKTRAVERKKSRRKVLFFK